MDVTRDDGPLDKCARLVGRRLSGHRNVPGERTGARPYGPAGESAVESGGSSQSGSRFSVLRHSDSHHPIRGGSCESCLAGEFIATHRFREYCGVEVNGVQFARR